MLSRIGVFILLILASLIGLLVASQTLKPGDLHDFESADFYQSSAKQTSPGDSELLRDLTFDQTLSGDLSDLTALDVHVYPNFIPQVRRYAWYPYRRSDRLVISPNWSDEVASVTLDGEAISLTQPIELSAKNHGQEVQLTAVAADGVRTANYVILTMPHNFPPLKTQIEAPDEVAPGIITGLQAAPNNPTYSRLKQVRMLLYTQGIRGTLAAMRKSRLQPFDDFTAADLGASLDFEHREYLPFVSFVLDKYGTPLKYTTSSARTIFLPVTTSGEGGLLPEKGFLYKEVVMDADDNFAEAITRSFIAPVGEDTRIEIPRHLDQFDDGHHIAMTPWDTVQNLFYRIHPAGTTLANGEVLDVNVTSTYLYELDRDGNVTWEWDSIDHFPPSEETSYLPKDRYAEWDYFHTNGIRFAPGDQELIISARHLRAIANVDYASGDVNWVLADPASPLNEFTYIDDPLGGIGTLHAAIMRDDELLIFDNGHYETPEYRDGSYIYGAPIETRHDYTRVVSYKLDVVEKTATYQREWTYPERLVRTAGYLMFVPNGDAENLLISWGSGGAFTEYNPDNRLILSTDTGGMTYRFYKIDIDHWMDD